MTHTTLRSLDAALRALPLSLACDLVARTFGRVMLAHGAGVAVEPCPGAPGGVRVRSDRGPVVDIAADGHVIAAYCGDEAPAMLDGVRAVMFPRGDEVSA